VNPDQDNAAAVVEAVRNEAAAAFPGSDPDALLNKRVVFAAIYKVLPRPTTRDALAKKFSTLRAIFCSDRPTDPAALDLGAEWLEPFTTGDEQAWRGECLAARTHLRDNAGISHDDNQFDRME
jgi:hypothetical protein